MKKRKSIMMTDEELRRLLLAAEAVRNDHFHSLDLLGDEEGPEAMLESQDLNDELNKELRKWFQKLK